MRAFLTNRILIKRIKAQKVSSMKTRIYETGRMKDGKKVVHSGTPLEWLVYETIKWIFKAIFFCLFFWIIIPVKLLKRK